MKPASFELQFLYKSFHSSDVIKIHWFYSILIEPETINNIVVYLTTNKYLWCWHLTFMPPPPSFLYDNIYIDT